MANGGEIRVVNGENFGNPRVNVIIPTLNEEKNVCDVINRLRRIGCNSIFIVDGNSEDGTVESAVKLGAQVIIQNGKGKGGALRQAFEEKVIDGDIIVIMDADGSMAPEEIPLFTEAVEMGADVAKGSRYLNGGGSEDLTATRRVGNMILTGVLNFLFLTNYTDLCYGYMAFKKEALKKLSSHLKSDNFEIETEICAKSKNLGLSVVEIPSVERARRYGKSNLRSFRDGFSILKLVLNEFVAQNFT
jgi:glycosyltransferase involved in cell wall biosynthesis